MIVYLDASALVKRYVAEAGTKEVGRLIGQAEIAGTSLISRAEVSAALARAVRVNLLARDAAAAALQVFRAQWVDLVRLQTTETLIAKADTLAWEYELRGYDSIHLAAALLWQETIGGPVTLATFDRQLWKAGQKAGAPVWPDDLDKFTER